MQQCVHVALVGCLAIEDPRSVVRLRRLSLDHREFDVAEPHAAPLLWHVRQPNTGLERLFAQADERGDSIVSTEWLADFVALGVLAFDPMLLGLDHIGDESADLHPDRFKFGAEGEINRHNNQPDRCHQPIRSPKYGRLR